VEKIAAALPKRMFSVGSKMPARGRLPVNLGLYGLPRHRSAHLRETDENDAKAEVTVGMSAVGGGADVACQGLSGPFLANRRSSGCASSAWFFPPTVVSLLAKGDRAWNAN
jgi:hypothetical protein